MDKNLLSSSLTHSYATLILYNKHLSYSTSKSIFAFLLLENVMKKKTCLAKANALLFALLLKSSSVERTRPLLRSWTSWHQKRRITLGWGSTSNPSKWFPASHIWVSRTNILMCHGCLLWKSITTKTCVFKMMWHRMFVFIY